MREIKDTVCEFYCIRETVLTGGGRNIDVCLARQIFCFLAYRHTRASLRMVGIQVGGLDHTTVLHAVQKLPKAIRNSRRLADEISQLEMRIAEKVLLRSQGRF
jgi:chromosomal replication initiator protein